MIEQSLGLWGIACVAYIIMAMTGFGSAIVLVSLGTLLMPVQELIPIVALIELVACLALTRADWQPGGGRFWGPAALTMVAGSVVGAMLLKRLEPGAMSVLIGAVIVTLGGWLWFGRRGAGQLGAQLPARASALDMVVTGLAGVTGGLFGMSGPLMVWHFGRRFDKATFRRAVVPIFLASSVACVISYGALGMLSWRSAAQALGCVPAVFVGLWIGQRLFKRIPEQRFGQLIGAILVVVGAKMFF